MDENSKIKIDLPVADETDGKTKKTNKPATGAIR